MIQSIPIEIQNHLKEDVILNKIIQSTDIELDFSKKDIGMKLIQSIISQQLSTKAAATIYQRFINSFPHSDDFYNQISNKPFEDLRACGLSGQKSNYVKNVANYFMVNNFDQEYWDSASDSTIINQLSSIKGVGKWTVEMLLIFTLHRPDVLPLDDLVIRNQIMKLYNINTDKKNLYKALENATQHWRPYRSYACRYLWAAKDLIL